MAPDGVPVAELPEATVAAIVSAIEPGSRVVSCQLVTSGISSYMHDVRLQRPDGTEHELMIRRSRRPDAQRWSLSIATEAALLGRLHGLGLPVARPRLFDDTDRFVDQQIVVLDRLPGATRFATDDAAATGRAFAEVLAAVHGLQVAADDPVLRVLPRQVDVAQWFLRPPDRPLDTELDEAGIRARIAAVGVPGPPERLALLHGDFFPGNVLWEGDRIVAIIDWEDAAIGDPLADVAISRLDLWWTFGREAASSFLHTYLDITGADTSQLGAWELLAAMRPMGNLSVWAVDSIAHGQPNATVESMRTVHREFVAEAIARL